MSIHLEGYRIYRGEEKIGWIDGHHLYNEAGHRVGYWDEDNGLYNMDGHRLMKIHENQVITQDGRTNMHLDDAISHIQSSNLSDIEKLAIKVFFGD